MQVTPTPRMIRMMRETPPQSSPALQPSFHQPTGRVLGGGEVVNTVLEEEVGVVLEGVLKDMEEELEVVKDVEEVLEEEKHSESSHPPDLLSSYCEVGVGHVVHEVRVDAAPPPGRPWLDV